MIRDSYWCLIEHISGLCHAYVQTTLSPHAKRLVSTTKSLEVDPAKLGPNDNLEENQKRLIGVTKNLLEVVFNSSNTIPTEVTHECLTGAPLNVIPSNLPPLYEKI